MPFKPFFFNSGLPLTGLWEIQEDESFFLENYSWKENDLKRIDAITVPEKRLEWLSSRAALKELLSTFPEIEIGKLGRAPVMIFPAGKVAFSHSFPFSGAWYHPQETLSIDLECLDRKIPVGLEQKFMGAQELAWFRKNPVPVRFLLIWSMKETLFKLLDYPGLKFREQIFLNFVETYEVQSNGNILAKVLLPDRIRLVEVYYRIEGRLLFTAAFGFLPDENA